MNEPVRMIADWLESPTTGVNAILDTLPRDGGDAVPADVFVYDETRDDRPARGRMPEDDAGLPAVVVFWRSATHLPRPVVQDDGYYEGEVVVRYVAKGLDASAVKQAGGYVLRAVLWSLRQYRATDVGHASRTRNSVFVQDVGPARIEPWYDTVEDTVTVGTVVVPVTWRDFASI